VFSPCPSFSHSLYLPCLISVQVGRERENDTWCGATSRNEVNPPESSLTPHPPCPRCSCRVVSPY
ncbi:unnamed protein product, partial [Ectocarpus sp. 13 AM-2016]